jgi:hypothetical protein
MSRPQIFLAFCILVALVALFALPQNRVGLPQNQADETLILQPHRAVYDISLGASRGRNSLSSATGKLTYEFTGNRCDGYSTKTRFLTGLESQDGTTQITDMTSATFESGDGKDMRFVTAAKSNGKVTDAADGVAQMAEDGILEVTINKPKKDIHAFTKGILFPAQHTLKLLNTAKSGEAVFRADLFDGSEGGKKAYATTGIIGKNMQEEIPADSPAAKLAKLTRYKISLSFFDPKDDHTSEQISLYDINSVMFDNGVTYSMQLNYPDFSIEAKLEWLEVLPVGECK